MNHPQNRLGVALLLLASLAGCTSNGIATRIQEKSAAFAALAPEQQKDIRSGTIAPGFTADMVYMALGQPSKVRIKDTSQGKIGLWVYSNFYPEGFEPAPPPSSGSGASETPPPATSSFTTPGSSDYGHVKYEKSGLSYTNLGRHDSKLYQANASTFDKTSGEMEPLDVPDMPSASLYVYFHEGRVIQIRLGTE